MGRYTESSCKLCRREGMQLFLKGDRCYTAKCPIQTGRPPPGMHGARRRKISDYGVQLREKQRLRRLYGMQEGPFRLLFEKASRLRGVTGEALLQMLEMRLDSVVRRAGFAPSQQAARQFVRHGHITVNGRKVDIPSAQLKAGDRVEVRDRERSREYAKLFMDSIEMRGMSPWLTVDKENFRCDVLHVPGRDEIAPIVNEQLIVELYSK
jgi:small subunit ribosomal protein S4